MQWRFQLLQQIIVAAFTPSSHNMQGIASFLWYFLVVDLAIVNFTSLITESFSVFSEVILSSENISTKQSDVY